MPEGDRRAELTAQATSWVLVNGFGNLALRPLAKAIGTSDRMLLYYFSSKEDLLEAIVSGIAEAMIAGLPTPGPSRITPSQWLLAVWTGFADPALRPALNVLFELDAMALRGDPAAQRATEGITVAWLSKVDAALAMFGVPARNRESLAELIGSAIVGLLLNEFLRGRTQTPKPALIHLAHLIESA